MADVKVKLREAIDKTFSIAAGQKHNFKFILPQVFVLDVEDTHFNHNRSILLPDLTAVDKSTPVLDARRVTGLGVLFAALVHGKNNPAQGLFVTGHTDGSGAASYNQTLSEERAKNVSLLLRGKRDDWRKQAAQDDAVDDYQTILKWQSMRAGWDTDPGPINNKLNAQTKKAIGEFQRRYTEEVANAKAGSPLAGKPPLVKPGQKPDQVVGKDTWGGFYDLYMEDLMDLLELKDVAQLEAMQAAFKFPPGMTDFVGCGEHIPHNPARRDPFVKQSDELQGPQKNPPDRRVEILFFDAGEEVALACHPKPGQCKPAECPVYVKGPHQQVPIGIPKGLNIAEVNLKLTFVDPEGKVRPFPEGVEIEAKFGDPKNETELDVDAQKDAEKNAKASEDADAAASPDPGADPDAESMEVDQEPNEKTTAGGLLRFVIPRKASKMFLRVLAGSDECFITADPKNLEDQQLVNFSEAIRQVGQGRVFFQLPAVFNTRQGYFKGPDGIDFKDGQFLNIDNRQTQIGSRGAPAELRLEIHWEHFKFEYFDRFTSSPTTVPQPRSKSPDGKTDVPPLVLRGFPDIKDPSSVPFSPLVESAWDIKVGKDTLHCLPWVRREIPDDGSAVRELPDDKCTTIFEATNLFVRTDGDGKSPDAPRAFVSLAPGSPELTTPGVDRLRLYDLPEAWWSVNYPARLGGDGIDKIQPFEKVVTTKSTPDKPYVISLDTIVLQGPDAKPDNAIQWNDSNLANRFTLLDNTIKVHKPDPPSGEPYFTKLADLKPQPVGPVLSDFPPFTRLIARGVVLYDVFDARTLAAATFKGSPIGARFAVRLGASSRPATMISRVYTAPRPDATNPPTDIGAAVLTFLRCCGHADGVELFNVVQYASVNFDFAPVITPALVQTRPLLKGAVPLPAPPANANSLVRDCLFKIADRWSGRDSVNGSPATFEMGKPVRNRGQYFALLTHGVRSAGSAADPGEIRINILKDVRAFMSGSEGFWNLKRMQPSDDGTFVGAHEFGHVFSEPDEYLNTDFEPSLDQPNISESNRSAGTPYGLDFNAMMNGNFKIRTRYFWDFLLAARAKGHFADATAMVVKHGPRTFIADITPVNQSRVRFPITLTKTNVAVGSVGLCDFFIYLTGQDEFTADEVDSSAKASPYDGFVVARVKMSWDFNTTTAFDAQSKFLSRAHIAIHKAFNDPKRLAVRGKVAGRTVRLRVFFAPRFISSTFPQGAGSAKYLGAISPALTPPLNTSFAGRVTSLIGSNGVHVNVRLGTGAAGVSGSGSPRQAVVRDDGTFLLFFTDSRFDDDVVTMFSQMVGLASGPPTSAAVFGPLLGALQPEIIGATPEFAG